MNKQALQLHQLALHLGQTPLLALNTRVEPGEIATVMGPSGSGKSTLLAAIAGFLAPDFRLAGEIYLGKTRIDTLAPELRGVGLMFQDPLLFPHLSIAQNLVFAMPANTTDKLAKASEALNQLGLAGYEHRDPETLSGGQKTRVALQRLLQGIRPLQPMLPGKLSKHFRHPLDIGITDIQMRHQPDMITAQAVCHDTMLFQPV